MSSGLRVIPRSENPAQSPIKIWWLLDELKRKKISQRAFAKRLGISLHALTGIKGVFPADKVGECLELLETWTTEPKSTSSGGIKSAAHPWSGPAFKNGKKL